MNSKAIRKQLLAAVAMVLVAAVALGSSTYAWFVTNSKVDANLLAVSASSGNGNLYIVQNTTASGNATTDSFTFASMPLYPVSTKDCKNWYVVTDWTDSLASSYTAVTPQANALTKGSGAYDYTYPGTTFKRNAYTVATFTIFTDAGQQDVYFNGNDAIKFAKGTGNDDVENVDKALRIGIVADGTLVALYAPYAETQIGNSHNTATVTQQGGSYYAVTSDGLTALTKTDTPKATDDIFVASLAGNKYVATQDNKGAISAAEGTSPLFTVDNVGKQVEVLMWLEGTDGECTADLIAGKADSNMKVTIDFAGIVSTATT